MRKAIIFFFITLGFDSCISEKAPNVILHCDPPPLVSFQQDILPIFNRSCNMGGCHAGSSAAGNLNLEPSQAYNDLMFSGSGYIDTVNPKFSLLYAQMISVSNPMPPTGKLDSCSIQLV